jgi:lysophospholipase L1-like esterase
VRSLITVVHQFSRSSGRRSSATGRHRVWFANFALAVVSLTIFMTAAEGYLRYLEASYLPPLREPASQTPAALEKSLEPKTVTWGQASITLPAELVAHMRQRRALLTRPEGFSLKLVEATCVSRASQWQGVIQISDQDGFRRCDGPFDPKRADIYRVMVVGDSLTYGAGIESRWTYPAQLQRLMGTDYRIEFINLGVGGAQSEDVVKITRRWLPILKPDLVIYGICLNDFLPSGIGQYSRWSVPFPDALKHVLLERTRVGRFVSDGYGKFLLWIGLSMDFVDDILKDYGNYQTRFGRDLVELQDVVKNAGLPPVVGMVLNHYPEEKGRLTNLVEAAEHWMRAANFDLISTLEYNTTFAGSVFRVSPWDGHPNEEANAIFAAMLGDRLLSRDDLRAYKTRHTDGQQ